MSDGSRVDAPRPGDHLDDLALFDFGERAVRGPLRSENFTRRNFAEFEGPGKIEEK
jgi:hypothetical protein